MTGEIEIVKSQWLTDNHRTAQDQVVPCTERQDHLRAQLLQSHLRPPEALKVGLVGRLIHAAPHLRRPAV